MAEEKSPEVKMLEEIASKIDTATKEGKELKALATGAKELAEKQEVEVKALIAKNTELGATIAETSKEVKELKAKQGRVIQVGGYYNEAKSLRAMIEEKIVEHKDAIAASANGRLIEPIKWNMSEQKASVITTSGSFTGTNAPYRNYLDWQPGMEPTGQFRFRSMVRTIQSDLDNVSFPRANTPIGTGSFGRQVLETDTKAQVDRAYTMIDVLCQVKAGYAIVARRALVNIRFLQSWLPTSMMEQLEDLEDVDFINAVVSAATGSSSTTGMTSTAVNTGLIKLIASIKNLIQAKYNPGMIVCDPNTWANLFTVVETNAGFSLPNTVVVDTAGNVRVLGRVVQPVNWLSGGRYVIADWSKIAIVESEGLTMRQSDSHDQIFAKNQIAFLLERVENVAIFRPDAVVTAVI